MKIHQKLKVISVSDDLVTATTLIKGDVTEPKVVNIETLQIASASEAKAFDHDWKLLPHDRKKKNLHLKFRKQMVKMTSIVNITISPAFGEEVKIKPGDTLTLTIN